MASSASTTPQARKSAGWQSSYKDDGTKYLLGQMPTAELQTERLILRRLTPDDTDAIFAIIGDPIAMRYYPRTFTREDAQEWIDRNLGRYEKDEYGLLAIALKSNGEVIGDCGLSWQLADEEPVLELGYHLRRDHWGHGYVTEAARACMDYAFRVVKLDKLVSLIKPENVPSRRVAERNRMRAEREVMHSGEPHLLYVMTRENYGQA
jgi:ribosomal-protein-alanine N-acetyltransferase